MEAVALMPAVTKAVVVALIHVAMASAVVPDKTVAAPAVIVKIVATATVATQARSAVMASAVISTFKTAVMRQNAASC